MKKIGIGFLVLSIACFVGVYFLSKQIIDSDYHNELDCRRAPVKDGECRIWDDNNCLIGKIKGMACVKEASVPGIALIVLGCVFLIISIYGFVK